MFCRHRSRRWFFGRLMACAAVAAVPASGWAHGQPGSGEAQGRHRGMGEWMRARVLAQVEDALDAAKATPEQRKAVQAEVETLLAQLKRDPKERMQWLDQGLALLRSDKPDAKTVQALLQQHLSRRQQHAAQLGAALLRLHGLFSGDQRKAIATYVRQEAPSPKGKWRMRMMKWGVERRVGMALDRLAATPDQRKAVAALVDKGAGLAEQHMASHREQLDAVLQAWQGERFDDAVVKQLLGDAQIKGEARAQTVAQLALDLHRILTPAQRTKLADFVAERRSHGGWDDHHGDSPTGAEE